MATAEAAPAVETDALDPDDFALIPTESIRRAEENRTVVDDEDFRALVENIRDLGILSPLLVRPLGDKTYELIAGERRWTAAKELGLETVPAFLLDYTDDADRLTVMIAENLHRRNLSTMEQARHVGILADLGLSQRDIAERLRVSQPQVSKLHSLLKLPPKAQEWVDAGELTQADAVKIAALPAPEVKKLVPAKAEKPPRDWEIERAYEEVRHQAANVKGREKAKELGLRVVKQSHKPSTTAYDNGPVTFPRSSSTTWATLAHVDKKAHETEKCHAVFIEAKGDKPILVPVCTNPAAHPRPKGWKPKNADKAASKPAPDPWAEKRRRKEAAVAAHLPAIEALTRRALEVALKRDEDESCLDFAAYAAIDMDQGNVWDACELLGIEADEKHRHSSEPLVKSLLAPTADIDGFAVLYALALAGGLQVVKEEIGHLAEGGKRDGWQLPAQNQTKAFLNHLDGLIEGVPKYEDLVAAVKSGKPLGGGEVDTGADNEVDNPGLDSQSEQTVLVP